MHHDNWKEVAADLRLENDGLRERNKRLESDNWRVAAENRNLRDEIRHCNDALRAKRVHCTPVLVKWDADDVEECRCNDCETDLPWREWAFCPMCGSWIDWDRAAPPEPDWDALRDAREDR